MAKVYGSSRVSCPFIDSSICVMVVDPRKAPVGQVDFELVDTAKITHKGSTDAQDGAARFAPFLKGAYTLHIKLKPELKKAYKEPPPHSGHVGAKEETALVKLEEIKKPEPDPYFHNWIRIEPRCRSQDFSRGLEARTADPLWMLARQWQVGELKAEDAGSPIDVRVKYQSAPFSVALTAAGAFAKDLNAPIETLVEREKVRWDYRLRVRAGQQFERLARVKLGTDAEAVIAEFRKAFSLAGPAQIAKADRQTGRFLQLMAGRSVNGQLLLGATAAMISSHVPGSVSARAGEVVAIVDAVRKWFEKLYSQPPQGETSPAWVGRRLEYEFELHASVGDGASVRLPASAYRNGELDWHTFKVAALPQKWAAPAVAEQRYPPVRVGFGGMPNRRWWAFEDYRVDFGGMEVGKPDIAKLALMEFGLLYSDDWFLIPLGVPLGSVTAVREVAVVDVFGQVDPRMKAIPRARSAGRDPLQRWEMFGPTDPDASGASGAEVLVVPPVLSFREESSPLEEVRFLRDEGADMVWGVEHLIVNGLGEPVSGFEAQLERLDRLRAQEAQAAPAPPAAVPADPKAPALPIFRLATTVPENWIPFLPADANAAFGHLGPSHGRPSVRLCRAQMLRNEAAAKPEPIPAMTRLLDLKARPPLLWLDEETVAREGAKVQLTRQRTRWTNGETFVWLGRKIVMGRGEGNSGLRFDVLRDPKRT